MAVDAERGQRRLTYWTDMEAFRGPAGELDNKLAALGVSAKQLVGLLGEDDDALAQRLDEQPPGWYERFTAAWETTMEGDTPAASAAGQVRGWDGLGFVEVARPLITAAQQRLHDALRPLVVTDGPLASLPALLAASVPVAELRLAVTRMVVLELNVARVEGRLVGADPQARLGYFLQTLRDRQTTLRMWQEYPVLARYIVCALDAWVDSRVLFGRRLLADFPHLRRTIWAGRDTGRLTEIVFGAGDPHRGGHTVALVRFERAGVVYKPRSLAVDAAFGGLLEWFNAGDPAWDLRHPVLLERAEYGWVEWVHASACVDDGELGAFYWRLGALLALLYALRAVDFHAENLIAAGADPVLVDLEGLLHPSEVSTLMVGDVSAGEDPAETALHTSVLCTGLLPDKIVFREGDQVRSCDLSGVSGGTDQPWFTPVPVLEDLDGDTMRFGSQYVDMPATDNKPRRADGAPVDIRTYREDLRHGFGYAYQRVCAAREELLGPGGVIVRFADAPIRLFARPTCVYGRLLQDSLHPDYLRDALDRERVLARLCEGWVAAPSRNRLITAEMRAIQRGDIPLFEVRSARRDVWLDDGTRVDNVLDQAPLEAVGERITRMGARDLAQQLWIIDGAYAALTMGEDTAGWSGYAAPMGTVPATRDQLVEVAQDIAVHVGGLAIRDQGRVGWITTALIDDKHWVLGSVGLDIYDGLPGIGLFLSYAAQLTGDSGIRALADQVADQVVHWLRRARPMFELLAAAARASTGKVNTHDPSARGGFQTGVFAPLLGPAYYLAHVSRVHRSPDYADAACELLLPFAAAAIDDEAQHDLINGAAGAILALLALHEVVSDSDALTLAQRAAAHLLRHRVQVGDGFGWCVFGMGKRPLTGLSHGASGVAIALARLHALSPHRAYLETICGALRYEAAQYDERVGNWRDLRPDSGGAVSTWCHGAPGIGLARLDLLRHDFLASHHPVLGQDLQRAVAATAAAGLLTDPVTGIGNHSLCHGDMGNLELLVTAAGSHPEWVENANQLPQIIATILTAASQTGWLCGVPGGVHAPGLMTGLAGIGYNLLRFADPDAVPSVLLVQPPCPPAANPHR